MTTKAQELVDYLNARIARTDYNERQVLPNRVHFVLRQGKKYAKIVLLQGYGELTGSVYAFVDAEGNIYKAAGYKAPARGVRATVAQVVGETHPFFRDGGAFDVAAYSTGWLYAS
jgi:hypothetical protein